MRHDATIAVVIPALNEEGSIGSVIDAIPSWVDDIVVGDNGSTDRTAEIARARGARVVSEHRRGYGSACLAALTALDRPDIVVFLDGDYSDHPEEMGSLVDPIIRQQADLVIGSRVRGQCERGALAPQARFGNRLACLLLRWIWGVRYTDLGPFRAIRRKSLDRLNMRDPDYGWTVEMQVKAAAHRLRAIEVPVSYRPRIGKSKVSGTIRGIVGAGTKILWTIVVSVWMSRSQGKEASSARHLVVFARYPEPGATKTRLIPALGAEGAATLTHDLTRHTLEWVGELRGEEDLTIEVRFAGGDEERMRGAFGQGFAYLSQGTGDLGERMARAFEGFFDRAAGRVVIVGTDCPELTDRIVVDAFHRLGDHDLVLGPAHDGGYYLIGLRSATSQLFHGIEWGTESVLQETLERAAEAGLSHALLKTLHDIDRPEDLERWYRETNRAAATADTRGTKPK